MKMFAKAVVFVALCFTLVVAFAESVTPASFFKNEMVWQGQCTYKETEHECFAFVKNNKKYMVVGATKKERLLFEETGKLLSFHFVLELQGNEIVVVWSKDKET